MTAEPEHWHLAGRGCCPHPDCAGPEERRVAKGAAIILAKKIKEGAYDGDDVKRLADLVIHLLDKS